MDTTQISNNSTIVIFLFCVKFATKIISCTPNQQSTFPTAIIVTSSVFRRYSWRERFYCALEKPETEMPNTTQFQFKRCAACCGRYPKITLTKLNCPQQRTRELSTWPCQMQSRTRPRSTAARRTWCICNFLEYIIIEKAIDFLLQQQELGDSIKHGTSRWPWGLQICTISSKMADIAI